VSNTTERFQNLLLKYSQENHALARREIEAAVWKEFGAELTVMVLDMSGFTEMALRHGVVHYLSMVRRMQLTARPTIETYGGRVVKFEADNCYATLPVVTAAIRACIALNLAFDAANLVTEETLDIRIACGIDTGKILLVGEDDFFGNAVNRASKLGEDVAGPGEILVTQSAMELVQPEVEFRWEPLKLAISGIQLDAARILYQREPVRR